ncbi:MAG: YcaQ family DNA glycosylase, partial [Anaerolineae bacterium]|nr:YcaQ family DNA glycosylase [Anaerolineae bacterium]
EETPGILDHVRDRIRAEGPLGAADFQKPEGFNGGWWDWKPAKHALEALFNMGELMVTKRRNFQRIFDLTERVLPPDVDTTPPTEEELQRFIIHFALANGGIVQEKEIKWGYRKADSGAIRAMVEAGEVVALEVEGVEGEVYYALREVVAAVAQFANGGPTLHIFSPFDNFTIDRRWIKTFFDGFDYSIECYLPAAKRKYGYFVLPIFWDDAKGNLRFIARMDSKADRKPKTLIVKRLLFEPDFDDDEDVFPALADKLRAFAAFNGCDHFAVEDVQPEKVRETLVDLLGSDA